MATPTDHGEAYGMRPIARAHTTWRTDNVPAIRRIPLFVSPVSQRPADPHTNERDLEDFDQNRKSRRASAPAKVRPRRVTIHRFFSKLFRSNIPDTPLTSSSGESVTTDYFSNSSRGNLPSTVAEKQPASFNEIPTGPTASSREVGCPLAPDSASLAALSQSTVSFTNMVTPQQNLPKMSDQRKMDRKDFGARTVTRWNFPATPSDSRDMEQPLLEDFNNEPCSGPTWPSCCEEDNWYYASHSTPSHSAGEEAVHQDLPGSNGLRPSRAPTSLQAASSRSAHVIALISPYTDHVTWKTLRLICRECYHHLTRARPPKMPAVFSLPTELLQQIYGYLGPVEFEAARHTCHAWMQASLHGKLLTAMLKRGGWWSAASHNIPHNPHRADLRSPRCHSSYSPSDRPCSATSSDLEWILSRHLSRECSLRPDWTGNGLSRLSNNSYCSARRASLPAKTVGSASSGQLEYSSRFVLLSTTDFSELSASFSDADEGVLCGLLFTVSTCGRFLLVAEGCLVYAFELLPDGDMRPMASVVCPRRVLALSMDASSGRLALAALMDGRMGMVCDLQNHSERHWPAVGLENGLDAASRQREKRGSRMLDNIVLPRESTSSSFSRSRETAAGEPASMSQVNASNFTSKAVNSFEAVGSPVVNSNVRARRRQLHADPASSRPSTGSPPVNIASHIRSTTAPVLGSNIRQDFRPSDFSTLPISSHFTPSSGPLSTYRGLCSNEDPPRSVAICPSRRCVAFGCSQGIELHWVDAASSRDLNRWFPLTAASDHLYFLPPRLAAGESAKRLRIISSTAAPNASPAIRQLFCGRKFDGRSHIPGLLCGMFSSESQDPAYYSGNTSPILPPPHGVTSPTFDNDSPGARWASRITVNRSDGCDHYRAVPVSDGCHILYTDPTTYQVCLGTDAPIGGPTKLVKRVILVSPPDAQGAIVYASGRDLRWGLRIIVAYGDHVVFFSIPPDVLEASRYADAEAKTNNIPFYGPRTFTSAPDAHEDSSEEDSSEEEYPEWYEYWPGHIGSSNLGYPIFPLRLQCVDVGRVKGIVDLAISGSGADFEVWAFSADGLARTWKVSGRAEHWVRKRIVTRDGRVLDKYDSDGDALMLDAYSTAPDKACEVPREEPTPSLPNAMLEKDGDYRMRDADSIDDEICVDGATEVETIDACPADQVQTTYSALATGLDGASDVLARVKTFRISHKHWWEPSPFNKEDEYWGCTKYRKLKKHGEVKRRRRSRVAGKTARLSEEEEAGKPVEKFTVWCSIHRVYRDENGVFWLG